MEEDKNMLDLYMEVREEDRVVKVVVLFKEGYNCFQFVVMVFVDLYGFICEQVLYMFVFFGGGIGWMCEICGVVCGMFLLVGLEKCVIEGKDCESKVVNYVLVQELVEEFKKWNGVLWCVDLLGLFGKELVVFILEVRMEWYYVKCFCVRMVEEVVWIWSEYFEK